VRRVSTSTRSPRPLDKGRRVWQNEGFQPRSEHGQYWGQLPVVSCGKRWLSLLFFGVPVAVPNAHAPPGDQAERASRGAAGCGIGDHDRRIVDRCRYNVKTTGVGGRRDPHSGSYETDTKTVPVPDYPDYPHPWPARHPNQLPGGVAKVPGGKVLTVRYTPNTLTLTTATPVRATTENPYGSSSRDSSETLPFALRRSSSTQIRHPRLPAGNESNPPVCRTDEGCSHWPQTKLFLPASRRWLPHPTPFGRCSRSRSN